MLIIMLIALCAYSQFLNSVQNFDSWQTYFNHPKGSELGLLSALYMIGGVISIVLV